MHAVYLESCCQNGKLEVLRSVRPRSFEDRLNCCAVTNLGLADDVYDDDDDDSTFLSLILCLIFWFLVIKTTWTHCCLYISRVLRNLQSTHFEMNIFFISKFAL